MIYEFILGLFPAIIGAILTALILRFIYKNIGKGHPKYHENAVYFTYSARARKIMFGIGILSALFAAAPLTIIFFKYNGADAIAITHSHYRPTEDFMAGFALFFGFGLAAYACLIDPLKYYAKLDDTGVTIHGLFSGKRFCRWEQIDQIHDHASLQLISMKATGETGKKMRLWIPYLLDGLDILLERFYQHGYFLAEQENYIEEAKQYFHHHGLQATHPTKLFLPFLSIWPSQNAVEKSLILILGCADHDEEPYFEHLFASGSLLELLEASRQSLEQQKLSFHPDFQKDLSCDLADLINEIEKKTPDERPSS